MSTKIYYFSGTGNSLALAREIKKNLQKDVVLVNLAKFKDEEEILINEEAVGFVFPVYFVSVPEAVKGFIRKLNFKTKPYIFVIVTCNGVPGNSLVQFNKLLIEREVELSSSFVVSMPGNALVTPRKAAEQRLAEYKSKAFEIADAVNHRSVNKVKGGVSLETPLVGKAIKSYGKSLFLTPENASCTSACIGCGTCARVCPLNNIKMVQGKPSWGDNCTTCLACFHWCPKKAVRGGKMLNKREKYHHPEISVKDMCFNDEV